MTELLAPSVLSDAISVVQTASDRGMHFVLSLIQHWSVIAERQLTDVYQIPDERNQEYLRYQVSLARSVTATEPRRAEEAIPEDEALSELSKVTYPAWSKSGYHAKAIPDATAWRNLSKRASRLSTSTGPARLQLLVSLRKWRPPMAIQEEDPVLANQLKVRTAFRTQRTFWRSLKPEDVEYLELNSIIQAANGIAEALEKRYKDTSSKAWERWCQGSLANGGRKVIRWLQAPERGVQTQTLEAPGQKLQRIRAEWSSIWGHTQPVDISPPQDDKTDKITLASFRSVDLPADTNHFLPLITNQEVRQALGTFSKTTAVGADGGGRVV